MSARNAEKIKMLDAYNTALSNYKARNFQDALQQFENILKQLPDDGPTKLYIARSKEFIKNPPPDNWNGVNVMTTK
ncbi:MAG: hypothetical protein OEZ36_04110 [Spirochaetota bacterium]|nr:hypothetical protein [Spirochaetota bacterium]